MATLTSASLNIGVTSNACHIGTSCIQLLAEHTFYTANDNGDMSLAATVSSAPLSRPVEDNPFLFLGGLGYWNEPNLGLSYVRARWLDTQNAQWLAVDPFFRNGSGVDCTNGSVRAPRQPTWHGISMSVQPSLPSPPLLPPPTPNAAEVAAFASWYQGHFGVTLDPNEAKERLTTLAHFFFYTRGYATYPYHFTTKRDARHDESGAVRAVRPEIHGK